MDDIMVYSPNIWSTGQAITVAKMNRIEEALEYAVTYVNAYRNNATNISNAISRMETAQAQFESVITSMNNISTTANAAKTEIDNIKTELDDGINYPTLIAAARAYKNKIALLTESTSDHESRLRTAEGTLSTLATETVPGHTASIATLETASGQTISRVQYIGTELGMYNSSTDTWTNENSRLDSIEATLDVLTGSQEGEGTIGSIQEAISAINSTLNHETTGLAATKTIADRADAGAVAANAKIGSGFDADNTVAGAISTINSTLSGKANSSDVSAALALKADTSALNTLSNKVDGISTTVVVPKNKVTYSDGIPTSFDASIQITDKNDYLIQSPTDDKYYYWKAFVISENPLTYGWQMISGAGGSGEGGGGNNNAEYFETYSSFLEADPATNKDYYVLRNDGIVHHYRYIGEGTELNPYELIEIGQVLDTANIKKYNMQTSTEDEDNYLDLYEFDYGVSRDEFDQGTRIKHIKLVGGGGSGTVSSRKFTRITPRLLDAAKGASNIILRFFYTTGVANESESYKLTQSNDDMVETIVAQGTIESGDPAAAAATWPETTIVGFQEIDISEYCTNVTGTQTFTLTAYDADAPENNIAMTWKVNVVDLTVSSEFTQQSISALNQSVRFSYIPSGNVAKRIHFVLDGTEIGYTDLSARVVTEQTYDISMPQAGEGVYKLSVYATASINSQTISSQPIYRDLIWRDSASSSVIIGSPYRGQTIPAVQYETVTIPYSVAGSASTYEVKYYVDDGAEPVNTVTLRNTNGGEWQYKPLTTGTHTLKIMVGEQYITVTLNVAEMTTDIAPVLADLALDFNPQGLTNESNSAKNWTNGTYHLTVSNNFDWYNGGYGHDADGDYFLVKSGTRAYFDYKMFMAGTREENIQGGTISTTISDIYRTGQEMKVIFKTAAVRSIDAVWFSNTGRYDVNNEKEVGIQLSAHSGWLKTDSASDTAITGNNDEEIAATNTYLYFPYSEEDRIELDININKQLTNEGNFIMSYEDGVPSKAYPYTDSQKLYHAENHESIITIGSDDCDVYIYRLRIYNNELTPAKILRNFIADGKDVDECKNRYNRNAIYFDSDNNEYSPYADANFVLDPEALAKKIPNVKVLMLDAPNFTESKKSFIKDSTLRCIHAPGGTIFPSRGAADNWFFENGYHAGQGTTSDKYGDAGRNIDFLFNCDGSHKPSDKVDAIGGYVSQVTTGYGSANPDSPSVVTNWKGNSGKISLTSTSIPNNFFNFKVNIASSENVNNALLQKRYNDFLPYISPAKRRDSRIKNDMEFVPAVLFLRENDETISTHKEFKDTNWHYYALGNLGDSKKTDYTRAYDPTDMNEFTLEISDNNTNNSQFQTGVYKVGNVDTLEEFTLKPDMKSDGVTPTGSYTAQGAVPIDPYDYVYPLDTPALKAMWNAVDGQGQYTNKAHWALVNEPYDGDHSFEMRYACLGDYRDGKLVNDTTGEAEAQLEKNSKVWQAFYSWVVTASDQEFVQNLDQWCVRSAVEFWYAFTHYYTMMDNRAKNTFWHFAKTGTHREVLDPIDDMIHTYDELDNGEYVRTSDTTVQNGKTYYTEYAFDLWDYDNDTALGIDNNGELIFPYGKEDSDHKIDGDDSSGYVFNGAGSVFWRRLRDLCTSEISSIFTTVNENFFSAENLIEKFDEFQECYPEALWQIDINRKYVRPYTGESVDNSVERNSTRFLRSMMQGRKKYQRRQWIKDQYYYFGSKYKLNNILNDRFLLDCYTGPHDALIAELKAQGRDEEAAQYVGSNWNITITPYQNMYLNASFGETPHAPIRAKAGKRYELEGVFTSMSNSRIYIYGASRLQALEGKAIRDGNDEIIGAEGLASLYIGNNELEKTAKLRSLNLGTDKTTYTNSNFNTLTIGKNNPILENLNVKNCGALAGELDLSESPNLKVLEAEGTNYSRILFAPSSQLTTLHLPSTITSLTLLSARLLTNFYMKNKSTGTVDYSNLRELTIDSSDNSANVDWMSIANSILTNATRLQLLNLSAATITNISELEPFVEKRNSLANPNNLTLSGTLNVTGTWSQAEKESYAGTPTSTWPDLTLNTTGTEQIKCKITYINTGVTPYQVIETRYVNENDDIPDIYASTAVADLPTKAATIEQVYQFGIISQEQYLRYSGWSLSPDSAASALYPTYNLNNPYKAIASNQDVKLYTHFNASDHEYQVKWYLDNVVVKTSTGQYYGGGYSLESPTVKELREHYDLYNVTFNADGTVTYRVFDGWEKLPSNITPTAEEAATNTYRINAKWYTNTVPLGGDGGLFSDTSSPTLDQLLVLSRMNSTQKNTYDHSKNIVSTLKYNYTMGFDGTKTGTEIVNGTSVRRFNADTSATGELVNGVIPFSTTNGFTLVLDYQMEDTQVSGASAEVLVGCYDKVNGNITGFALYNNFNASWGEIGPRVGYGNMFSNDTTKSFAVGMPNQRNIVVLRHPKNSSELIVYSSKASTGSTLSNTVTVSSPINVNTQITTDGAVLCLGNLRTDLASNSTFTDEYNSIRGAYGTIYWAKYWDEDLGAGECKQLASWPRERMTAMIASIDDWNDSTNATRPHIYLTNLNSSSHATVSISKFASTAIEGTSVTEGYGTSKLKEICDNRIFSGLPIRLQAVLAHPNIGYLNYVCSYPTGGDSVTTSLSNVQSAAAYVYVPSISSLKTGMDSRYASESRLERTGNALNTNSDITPYTWIGDANSMLVYDYNTSVEGNWAEGSVNYDYYNLRFFNKPISWSSSNKMRVFRIPSNALVNKSIKSVITDLKSNDIVVFSNGDAYIYITSSEYNAYGYLTEPQGTSTSLFNTNGSGGWLKSSAYMTRSVSFSTFNQSNFIFINTRGETVVPAEAATQPGTTSMTYAFTI